MTEKQITKQMIKYCEAKIKKTPELKNSYYKKIIKLLKSTP